MARGRMLNRKVATSEKVAAYGEDMGGWAVVFHHRLVAFLDKNGCCRADPYWLKAEVMPRVSDVSPETCRLFVAALERVGLAFTYEARGMLFLHMPGFRGEQLGLRVDREATDLPPPDGFDEESGTVPDSFRKIAGSIPERLRRQSGSTPP